MSSASKLAALMMRCVRGAMLNPNAGVQQLASVGDEVRGAKLAREWAVAASNGKADGADNPLLAYFNGVKAGPGIWKWLHYFDIYHRHFQKFVGREVSVVEIGIYSGGSLLMWPHYFGDGCTVHGVDIEQECKVYEGPKTTVHIGDQADRAFWKRFKESVPKVDIVIDDGGHTPEQQMVTLEELLPHVRPGGVYVCEDIHQVDNRFTTFAHSLARELNYFPSGTGGDTVGGPSSPFQSVIHSVHFYPFMLVIEKRDSTMDSLYCPKHGTQWQPFVLR